MGAKGHNIEIKQPENDVAKTKRSKWFNLPTQAWRRTLCLGAIATSTVLLLNVVFLIWLRARTTDPSGVLGFATIYQGSCDTAKSTVIWSALVINILSTALLAASNNCAQLITSPSRAIIDQAHSTGKWLDVGVASIRNIGVLKKWEVICWALLYLSATPLHLLYNSVIFYTTAANQYTAVMVTPAFLTGAPFNLNVSQSSQESHSLGSLLGGQPTDLAPYQSLVPSLTRLSNKDCIKAYSSELESGYGSVLLVTSAVTNESALAAWVHEPVFRSGASNGWLCGDMTDDGCDVNSLLANPTNWTYTNVALPDWTGYCFSNCRTISASIEYCLAQEYPPRCAVQASPGILIVVVVCNIVKLLCIVATICFTKSAPLATLGDAVESFLQSPEPMTKGNGPASRACYRKARPGKPPRTELYQGTSLSRQARYWGAACSTARWLIGLLLFAAIWATGLGLLLSATSTYSHNLWIGIFGFDVNNLLTSTQGLPVMANIVLANTPQVVVSFAYLFYNNILTCMMVAREWHTYSTAFKSLRVSHPEGKQRSTYWLQLPWIYSVPLMASMAVMHWALARSIFFIEILFIPEDNGDPLAVNDFGSIEACGFSVSAIALSLGLGGVLILALVALALRRFPAGMPLVGSHSLAISAACHPNQEEGELWLRPLKYGVVPACQKDADERLHVGFSSEEVEPLEDGVTYA